MEYLAAIIAEGPDRSSVQGFQFLLQDVILLARSPPPKPIITAPTGGGHSFPRDPGCDWGQSRAAQWRTGPERGVWNVRPLCALAYHCGDLRCSIFEQRT